MLKQIAMKAATLCAPTTYTARLADGAEEIRAAQALRFQVFNLELHEGLAASLATGLDSDPFDAVCDHLLVEHVPTGEIVGTYRLQSGQVAAASLGFYSEQEFDFAVFEPIRDELIELGRACIHRDHRNLTVLSLLWKGIANYAWERGGRYLCGCSSLTSQDATVGASAYAELYRRHLAPLHFRTQPTSKFECPLDQLHPELLKIPKLLRAYLDQTTAPLIVQRYVPDPHELGIFYYRMPDQPRGQILAITEKIFPVVVGDGRHTLEELVWRDERARFMAGNYLKRFPRLKSQVLPAGERLRLVEAGNHAQGCIFQDGAHLWSEALEQRIDEISRRLAGFYIGRYDLRYASEDKLRRGEGFQIIELNGAASEVTSIYDAKNSLTAAYRMLFRQWELVFAIGHLNRRAGIRPIQVKLLWQQWRQCTADAATYPAAD